MRVSRQQNSILVAAMSTICELNFQHQFSMIATHLQHTMSYVLGYPP